MRKKPKDGKSRHDVSLSQLKNISGEGNNVGEARWSMHCTKSMLQFGTKTCIKVNIQESVA
jgi:hypothetical protein